MSGLVTSVDLPGVAVFRRGKVRDTFDLGDDTLWMVATDRISAFDVVLPTPIPDKGRVLTQMSRYWFGVTRDIVANHLIEETTPALPAAIDWPELRERSMHVRKASRIDVECVVRGYLAGTGWKEYRDRGTLADEPLPAGLQESSKLPQPRFTPSTKSDSGHDENISRARLAAEVGEALAAQLEAVSLTLYDFAARHCEERGIILVDTKFEFGFIDSELALIDEVLTPDSSRFWEASLWQPGTSMPSFDKQPVRDWLVAVGWDKTPPAPELPDDIVMSTRDRYRLAAKRLCDVEIA